MDTAETRFIAFISSPKGLTVIVSVVAILLAIYILITVQSAKLTQTSFVNPTPLPSGNTQVNRLNTNGKANPLLVNTVLSFTKGTNAVDVTIDTGTDPVSGAALAITYNPSALTNVTVTPGTFFENPLILGAKVDAVKGVIRYTLSIRPDYAQIYGQGVLATIHYNLAPGTSTTLSFLPETKVTALGINTSLLKIAKPISLP